MLSTELYLSTAETLNQDTATITVLSEPIIINPISNHMYQINARTSSNNYVNINLRDFDLGALSSVLNLNHIDFASWCYGVNCDDCSGHLPMISLDNKLVVSEKTFPKKERSTLKSPLYLKTKGTNKYQAITRIDIGPHYERIVFFSLQQPIMLDDASDLLTSICKAELDPREEAQDIILRMGDYPIFQARFPTTEFLTTIYKYFYHYNKDKISNQYLTLSHDHCHVRAYFVSAYLKEFYKIPSIKVFQLWQKEDWFAKGFATSWDFHSVAGIICYDPPKPGDVTNGYKLLLWDPWVGNNSTLLHLADWALNPAFPTPFQLTIANSVVLDDTVEGGKVPGFNFLLNAPRNYRETYHALWKDAVPDQPESVCEDFRKNNKLMFFSSTEIAKRLSNTADLEQESKSLTTSPS